MLSMLMIISRGAYGITKAIHIVDMRKTQNYDVFLFEIPNFCVYLTSGVIWVLLHNFTSPSREYVSAPILVLKVENIRFSALLVPCKTMSRVKHSHS